MTNSSNTPQLHGDLQQTTSKKSKPLYVHMDLNRQQD